MQVCEKNLHEPWIVYSYIIAEAGPTVWKLGNTQWNTSLPSVALLHTQALLSLCLCLHH